MEEIKFKCVPVQERYYSESSSYGVYVFHTNEQIPERDIVPKNPFEADFEPTETYMSLLTGTMQQLYIGSEYEVTATLEFNKKYKTYQYKPRTIISVEPKTEEQQRAFLSSIVTAKQADTLLSVYPDIVDDIIKGKDNVDLSLLKGIGEYTYNSIKEKVLDNYVISDILALLQPLGVKYPTIKRLLSNESNPVLLKQKLIDNPYIMLDFRGFGFKTVDGLAMKINPNIRVTDKRTYAFIKYYLGELGNNSGHTWTNCNTLEDAVRDNIPECLDIYKKVIEDEKRSDFGILYFDDNKVGLKKYYETEMEVFDMLKSIQEFPPLVLKEEHIDNGIKNTIKEQGFELTEEQELAVRNGLRSNVTIITGSAGTGKTTISRALLNIYKEANYSIACCALSAKAAQRITEATGFTASTIHRLLGFNPASGFGHNHKNPLNTDVILVDECSMINSSIYHAIVSAVKEGAKIIMCGDNKQLPPIGYGNIFSDLLLMDDEFEMSRLTKVLRQAEKSGILSDANKIRNGQFPIAQPELKIVTGELQDMTYMFRDNRSNLRSIAIKSFLKAVEQDGLDEVALVVPRRENCENSALELNLEISSLLLNRTGKCVQYGQRKYYVGSKVIQTDNNYEKNVFNGEVGYVKKIEDTFRDKEKTAEITVEYKMNDQTKKITYIQSELSQIDLAYAYTCHRVQGNGYKTVIVILDMTHYTLLDTCMLYTAITRAKKRCLLLSEPSAFKRCLQTSLNRRNTWLLLKAQKDW